MQEVLYLGLSIMVYAIWVQIPSGPPFINQIIMKRKIEFYKDEGSWYANVPFVPKKNNLMVAGADKFLEHIQKRDGRVLLNVIVNPKKDKLKECKYILHLDKHDFWGGSYIVSNRNDASPFDEMLWICNVTHLVLGKHPKTIGIVEIE